jgi:hypothetical protein
MNGKEKQFSRILTFSDNFFCTVAVVYINVDNRTSLAKKTLVRNGVHCTSRNTVKNAKPA